MDKPRTNQKKWTEEEKEILQRIILQSNDQFQKSRSYLHLNKAWVKILDQLNEETGNCRSLGEVKLAWKRLRMAANSQSTILSSPNPMPRDVSDRQAASGSRKRIPRCRILNSRSSSSETNSLPTTSAEPGPSTSRANIIRDKEQITLKRKTNIPKSKEVNSQKRQRRSVSGNPISDGPPSPGPSGPSGLQENVQTASVSQLIPSTSQPVGSFDQRQNAFIYNEYFISYTINKLPNRSHCCGFNEDFRIRENERQQKEHDFRMKSMAIIHNQTMIYLKKQEQMLQNIIEKCSKP